MRAAFAFWFDSLQKSLVRVSLRRDNLANQLIKRFQRRFLWERKQVLDKPATRTTGPLAGFRIVEFAGIGPGPFACMMLADMGAEVVTLDRVGAKKNLKSVAGRGRKVVELDLKDKTAIAQVLDLLA